MPKPSQSSTTVCPWSRRSNPGSWELDLQCCQQSAPTVTSLQVADSASTFHVRERHRSLSRCPLSSAPDWRQSPSTHHLVTGTVGASTDPFATLRIKTEI